MGEEELAAADAGVETGCVFLDGEGSVSFPGFLPEPGSQTNSASVMGESGGAKALVWAGVGGDREARGQRPVASSGVSFLERPPHAEASIRSSGRPVSEPEG